MPGDVEKAVDAIRRATVGTEYEGRMFLVGGYVRDRILGGPASEDLDIVLEGDATALAQFLSEKGVSRHAPVIFARFGTAKLEVCGVDLELAGARAESYAAASRKPEVQRATLLEDAKRRDFTVNTLLENLHTGERLDPLGRALPDLSARLIVTPLEPEATFRDDPLRMLRAIRFAVRLGFELAPECAAGINSQAHRLAIVSGERIRDELTKMLMHKTAGDALRWMQRLGLLAVFAPELEAMVGVSQGGAHEWDVWEHTVRAVEALPGDASLVLRLAALLHDVAKPATRTVEEDGRLRFFDHQIVGLEMARGLLRRLRFASGEIAVVLRLIRTHMRPGAYSKEWSDGAVRRLMRDAGDRFDDLIALCKADAAAHRPDGKPPDFRELLAHVRKVESEFPAATATSPLDGNEIMEALGLEPGESVGRMKEALSEAVLDGRLEPGDKAAALRMLLKLWEAEG